MATSEAVCGKCGTENSVGRRLCRNCQHPIPAPRGNVAVAPATPPQVEDRPVNLDDGSGETIERVPGPIQIPDSSMFRCPQCGSESTAAFGMIHQGGTTVG